MEKTKKCLRAFRCIVTFAFGVSYLVNAFVGSSALNDANAALMALVVLLSLFSAKGSSRVIGVALLACGMALLAFSHASLDVWEQALLSNAFLIVMFIMIPLMGIPVRRGGYRESLSKLFDRYANSDTRYYSLVGALSALVGVLLSIAALPLTHEVSSASPRSVNSRLLGTALSRGFVTCMIWAPTSATIALVIQLTGADWAAMAPFALAMALVAFAIGVLFVRIGQTAHGRTSCAGCAPDCPECPTAETDAEGGRSCCNAIAALDALDVGKIAQLGMFFASMMVAVVAVSQAFSLSVIMVVSMAALVFPVLWMGLIRRLPAYALEVRSSYLAKSLPAVGGQIVLFTGAGLFAEGVTYSQLGNALGAALLDVTGQSALLLTAAVVGVTLIAAVVGIHPIVVVAVVGATLSAADCGLSAAYLALVLSVSWALSNALCPASANIIAVAGMVDVSPVRLGLAWNGPYVAVSAFVLVLLLSAVHAVGLL